MYRIEINLGKGDVHKWKQVRGPDSGLWGADTLSDAQYQMRMWFPNWTPSMVRIVKDEA